MNNKKFKNVGKLCPLCKKGVILYVNFKGGSFFTNLYVEFVNCSNKKCGAYIEIKS